MMDQARDRDSDVTIGSDNVFADLGYSDPDEALTKAALAARISAIIAERGLTQTAAADLLGIDQPKISHLVRGRLRGFSVDRLIHFLVALGDDVEIVVKPKPRDREQAHLRVVAA